MKSIAVFVLFLGMFLVVQGYYQQKLEAHKNTAKAETQIKFIPRSTYEDQLSNDQKVSQQFKSMFDEITTWPAARG